MKTFLISLLCIVFCASSLSCSTTKEGEVKKTSKHKAEWSEDEDEWEDEGEDDFGILEALNKIEKGDPNNMLKYDENPPSSPYKDDTPDKTLKADEFDITFELVKKDTDYKPPFWGVLNKITALDFKNASGQSQVEITTSYPVDFDLSATLDHEVVLDLKDAVISKIMSRALDSSEFNSNIYYVRTEQVVAPYQAVQVIVHLREPGHIKISQIKNKLVLVSRDPHSFFMNGRINFESPKLSAKNDPSDSIEGVYVNRVAAKEDDFVDLDDATPLSKNKTSSTGIGTDNIGDGDKGEDDPYADTDDFHGKLISFEASDAPLSHFLNFIATVSNLNIITSSESIGSKTFSIKVSEIPWDQALELVLELNKLGLRRDGNVILISTLAELEATEKAKKQAQEVSSSLAPTKVLLMNINYADANEIKSRVENFLKAAMTKDERIRVDVDTRTNTLIVEAIPALISKVRTLVEKLDIRSPQVLIEARIVEASEGFSREFGINWNLGFTWDNARNFPTLNFPNSVTGNVGVAYDVQGASAGEFHVGSINDVIDLNFRLTMGEATGKTKIISNPRETVLDGKKAEISQMDSMYIIQAGKLTTKQAITKLGVTPKITADGSILLNVDIMKESFTPDGNGKETKNATTEVMVESGDTTVIGGLYSTTNIESASGFPLLMHIPVLGNLFKFSKTNKNKSELLIFITPRIAVKKSTSQEKQDEESSDEFSEDEEGDDTWDSGEENTANEANSVDE